MNIRAHILWIISGILIVALFVIATLFSNNKRGINLFSFNYRIKPNVKTPLDVKTCKYSTPKTPNFERQPRDCIYLYKKDIPEKRYKLLQGISFGYGHNKTCCFPDNFYAFEKNYSKEKMLGKGTFGEVFQITTTCCKYKYALKESYPINISVFLSNTGYYDTELYFAKYFQLNPLPHTVKFYHAYFYRGKLYIVLELLENGTLEKLGFLDNKYDEQKLDNYIKGIFIGIASLHKNKIVHCDIKPANIGIDKNRNIKIFDFGISNKLDSGYLNMSKTAGTPLFMPPEYLFFDSRPSYQTDWWAFGVVLYVLTENCYPYEPRGLDLAEMCKNLKFDIEKKKFRDFNNNKLNKELKDLIKQLLEPDVTKRLGVGKNAINDILNHSYFKNKNIKERC